MNIYVHRNVNRNDAYRLRALSEILPDVEDIVERPVDVRHLFPYWIRERTNLNSSSAHFVEFVQSYYDWLYTKSGYKLSTVEFQGDGIKRLIDIDSTPVEFLKGFVFSYASGFSDWFVGATAGPQETDTTKNVRSLIRSIRPNLYQQKSNEEAYNYFFQSLHGEAGSDVSISYPKKNILRLNGGRFAEWPAEGYGATGYYENTQMLGGSFLNGDFKLQDSYWYQDFSYLLHAGVDLVDDPDTGLPIYFEDLLTMLHPAGLKLFFQKTTQDYIPPDDFEGGVIHGELPRLGNYFPYRLSSISGYTACVGCDGSPFGYDGPTAYIGTVLSGNSVPYGYDSSGLFGGVSGSWTSGDAWGSIGGGSVNHEYNLPTHNYPDWDEDIPSGTTFGSIYIREFIYLYPASDSPNAGYTGCTAGGGTGACTYGS